MKILIVDDEAPMRMLLTDILEPLDCEIVEADNCLEGLKLLQTSQDFDLALVDWRTPHMTGLELVREVKKDPSLQSLRLIMVTGLNDMSSVEEAIGAGVDDFLMKPFTQDMVFDKLRLVGVDIPDSV